MDMPGSPFSKEVSLAHLLFLRLYVLCIIGFFLIFNKAD